MLVDRYMRKTIKHKRYLFIATEVYKIMFGLYILKLLIESDPAPLTINTHAFLITLS